MRTPRSTAYQHGRSLIEVMVALVIGLIVLAAVITSTSSNSGTNREQDAIARMNEDASLAASLIAAQIRLAGYSPPQALSLTQVQTNYQAQPLHGCESGYSVNGAIANLACGGGAANTAPDAFTVYYEADVSSTQPTALGLPSDCLGNGIPVNTPSAVSGMPAIAVAQNRFYIDQDPQTGNPALYCVGNTGNAQPLIDNVVDMQLTYGVAALSNPADPDSPPLFQPVQYLTAAQVNALTPGGAAPGIVRNWKQVVSVRVCLMLQTDQRVLSQDTPQIADCANNGNLVNAPTPTQRRAYRVVNFVVSLRNRTTPCADMGVAAGPAGIRTATLCPNVPNPTLRP